MSDTTPDVFVVPDALPLVRLLHEPETVAPLTAAPPASTMVIVAVAALPLLTLATFMAKAPICMYFGAALLIVMTRVAEPVPLALLALIVTLVVPAVAGVPEITPELVFTLNPAGSGVAL